MRISFKSFLFVLLSLSSCVPVSRNYEVSQEAAIESNRMVIFEHKYFYKLVYDKETGVEYFYTSDSGFLTPLVDKDGKPKIHNGY